jgi:hypothetical protein
MGFRQWRQGLKGVPLLAHALEFVEIVVKVYDSIGWSDSTYRIGTSRERLSEAQKVASVGDRPSISGPEENAPVGETCCSLSALNGDQENTGKRHTTGDA